MKCRNNFLVQKMLGIRFGCQDHIRTAGSRLKFVYMAQPHYVVQGKIKPINRRCTKGCKDSSDNARGNKERMMMWEEPVGTSRVMSGVSISQCSLVYNSS